MRRSEKANKHTIRKRLFLNFALFAIAVMALMWLFQSVLLESLFTTVSYAKSNRAVKSIEQTLIEDSDDYSHVSAVASYSNACVTICDESLCPLFLYEAASDCIIHNLTEHLCGHYYLLALQGDGTYNEIVSYSVIQVYPFDIAEPTERIVESVFTVKIVNTSDGVRVVFYDMRLTPLTTIIDTVNIILAIVTVIMLGVALAVAFFTSRKLAEPISALTESAKELATGDYAERFSTDSSYAEIAELGEALNYAAAELSKVDSLKSEIVANISHDLRSPLTLIGGYAELMRDMPNENNRQNAQIIIDECQRLSGMVNDLLDLSKLQSKSDSLRLESFSLRELLDEIASVYGPLAAQGYSIRVSADDLAVVADRQKIFRVITNIVNNAVVYTGEDKRILIRATEHEGVARIAVSDTGAGIPENELAEVFERYYKASNSKKSGGSGLGLAIVKAILERHNARYGIVSSTRGTTVWFELKIAR